MRALVPTNDERFVQMAEVDEPSVADGQVLIEVEAFSINRGELTLLESGRPNWRPGQDVAGVVLDSPPDGPPTGARVVALADWEGWAERVAVPGERVAVLPDDLSTTQAAALPLAGVTALRLLRRAGSVLGERLLITGASGGVGHFLAQLATAAGASVTAVTRSTERGQRLEQLGATVVQRVEDAEGPFSVILESVAGEVFSAAMAKAARDALVLWFGHGSRQPITLTFSTRDYPGVNIEIFSYHYTPVARDEDLATLVRLVSNGQLDIEIGRQESWEHTSGVLADLRDRKIRGKAVLTVT